VVRHGVVVDRIVVGKTRRNRLAEAVTAAWQCGDGVCQIRALDPAAARAPRHMILRQGFTCSNCGARAAPPTPALFSWNSPLGACPDCQGFGRIVKIDRDKVVPDPRKNLKNHAVVPFSVPSTRGWYRQLLRQARAREIRTDVPFGKLAPHEQDWVFHGDEEFSGVEGLFKDLERKRYKMHVRIFISRFRGYVPCPRCGGSRLRPEALAFSVAGKTIQEIHEMPLDDLRTFFEEIDLPGGQHAKIRTLLESTRDRMDCLADLGVGYLTLARSGRTLSGGETQRIRIAAALGSSLTDTLFILDEPTVGLHATDTAAMVAALERLSRTGNTVVVVEHDPKVIESADHLIVLGPGGGREGGRLIYEGPPEAFLTKEPGFFVGHLPPENAPHIGGLRRGVGTLARERGTARRGRKKATRRGRLGKPWDPDEVQRWLEKRAAPPATPAAGSGGALVGLRLQLKEAREHNLQIPSLEIPLSGLTVITGVSGSGKSTLLDEIVHRNWLRFRGRPVEDVGEVARIDGLDAIDEAHLVGQNPLGRSSRSNPISFVKAYAEIRKLLGSTLLARQKGLGAGAFSFNVTAGRCEACRGMGTQVLDMYFLPDIEASCEVCGGKRFRPEVLEVKWQGKNIHDILQMTVDEATVFFQREGRIVERLAPMRDVGLGYIILGQSTATLSTGEAQRLRLGSFLAGGNDDERHLFLFDEPTTGLHARDVGRLLRALRALVARGHGVIAVEHQLDFIRSADWVVDLGPGPGAAGGQVVYAGPVGGLLIHRTSVTAEALREHIERVAAWQ
jgi:excinuclease ABC subunit A